MTLEFKRPAGLNVMSKPQLVEYNMRMVNYLNTIPEMAGLTPVVDENGSKADLKNQMVVLEGQVAPFCKPKQTAIEKQDADLKRFSTMTPYELSVLAFSKCLYTRPEQSYNLIKLIAQYQQKSTTTPVLEEDELDLTGES